MKKVIVKLLAAIAGAAIAVITLQMILWLGYYSGVPM